jgi:hypothetical protein
LINKQNPTDYLSGFALKPHAILIRMDHWKRFKDPRFGLVFEYPEETSQGHFVDKAESQQAGTVCTRLTSRDSKDLYFEVTKYQDLPAQMEYHQHRENLEQRFSELIITELKQIIWKSHPAYEYSFDWKQGVRSVILIERDDATYRILYNPRSLLNTQILSTVEWID